MAGTETGPAAGTEVAQEDGSDMQGKIRQLASLIGDTQSLLAVDGLLDSLIALQRECSAAGLKHQTPVAEFLRKCECHGPAPCFVCGCFRLDAHRCFFVVPWAAFGIKPLSCRQIGLSLSQTISTHIRKILLRSLLPNKTRTTHPLCAGVPTLLHTLRPLILRAKLLQPLILRPLLIRPPTPRPHLLRPSTLRPHTL